MRSIKEGDIVNVFWVENEMRLMGAKVLSTPRATGDLWFVEDAEGNVHAINPFCLNLESIQKRKKDNP